MADMTIPRLSGDAVANYEDINAAFAAAEQHGHGAITRDGKVGTVANMLLGTGVDGAIVAKTAQQASDILQRSNPNILHNWDWNNPINQRGVSGVLAYPSYFYDRWTGVGSAYEQRVEILQNGWIRIGPLQTPISQSIEHHELYSGLTMTYSVDLDDVSGDNISIRIADSSGFYECKAQSGTSGIVSVTHQVTQNTTKLSVLLVVLAGSAATIKRQKLEIGPNSTLAYDPPMDWATELLKCQRFFQLRSTNNVASVDMRPLMRISNPTVAGSGPYAYSADL